MYIRYGELVLSQYCRLGFNQKLVTFTSQNLLVSPQNNINNFIDAMNAVISDILILILILLKTLGHIRGQIGAVYLKAELDARNEISPIPMSAGLFQLMECKTVYIYVLLRLVCQMSMR